MDIDSMEELSRYWATVRPYYKGVDKAEPYSNTEVYQHEMPGGQFSNLRQQAKGVGLGERWNEVKKMYHDVNMMFGDIIKVTPSSKIVGDMTLFMVQNNLTEKDIYEKRRHTRFPAIGCRIFRRPYRCSLSGIPRKAAEDYLKGQEAFNGTTGQGFTAGRF